MFSLKTIVLKDENNHFHIGEQSSFDERDSLINMENMKIVCQKLDKISKECVRCTKISPNEEWIVHGMYSGIIKAWNTFESNWSHNFIGHSNTVSDIVFSKCSLFLYSTSADGSVRKWDTETGKLITILIKTEFWSQQLILTKDGDQFFFVRDTVLECRSTLDGKLKNSLFPLYHKSKNELLPHIIRTMALSKNNEVLATSCSEYVYVWDFPNKTVEYVLCIGKPWRITSVIIEDETRCILSLSSSGDIHVWNMQDGSLRFLLQDETFKITKMAVFSNIVAGMCEGSKCLVGIWDLNKKNNYVNGISIDIGAHCIDISKHYISIGSQEQWKLLRIMICRNYRRVSLPLHDENFSFSHNESLKKTICHFETSLSGKLLLVTYYYYYNRNVLQCLVYNTFSNKICYRISSLKNEKNSFLYHERGVMESNQFQNHAQITKNLVSFLIRSRTSLFNKISIFYHAEIFFNKK